MEERRDRFAERFSDTLTRSGWPRMSARIFATLMATPDGVRTASELSKALGVGASAISNGAKMLRTVGLVDVTRNNNRQISYEVRPQAWMEAVAHRDRDLRDLEEVLAEGARAAEPRVAARLAETADFFAYLRAELPHIVDRWRASR